MADPVLDLARRLIDLDQEALEVRAKLKAALLNGAEPRPVRPTPARQSKPGLNRAKVLEQAAQADEQVLTLLKAGPMTASEIGAATSGKASTVQNRLQRLREKGLVQRDDAGAWQSTQT
jgi:hypothetical protein